MTGSMVDSTAFNVWLAIANEVSVYEDETTFSDCIFSSEIHH